MKRILSFFISVILIIGMPISVYSSQEDTENIGEPSYDVSKSRELLASVGVVPSFSGSVTRADFVVALTALLKLGDASGEENCFYDVSADDSFSSSVNHALKLGIVSEGMYFRPNDFVTYSEACKMIVVILGYASYAEAKGGYPYGYITIASQIDINNNVDVGVYDALDADSAFIILANALTADMLVADSVVCDGSELMTGYGAVSSLMYVIHGLYVIEGVVGANDITNIYDFSAVCPEGFIMVGNTMYKSDYRPELGTYITAYVEKTGQTETVRYLTYDESLTITVYSGDMISFENRKLTYMDSDGREKTAVADYNFSAIYNGKAIADLKSSDMNIDVGKIVLINSDGDSDYDVISIHSAVVSYIDLVNDDTSVAVDSFTGNTYELNDKDKYRIYSGGEPVGVSAVTKGSVVEIYASKDNSHVIINILSETLSGTIKEKGECSLFIDSTEYEYCDYFNKRYMKNSDLEASNTFVLTECGKLAAPTQATECTGILGYAYKFASSGGIDNQYLIKVFTEEGNHVECEIAPKVRVNDSGIITSSELYSRFVNNGETIIRYSTNSDGKINAVIFPEAPASTTKDSIYVPGSDSKDILKPYVIEGLSASDSITYKVFGIFTPHFMISDDTKIFCIDPDSQKDEERYSIGSINTWNNDSNIPFGAMQIYNVTSIGRAGVFVVKHSVSSSLGASRALLGGVVESVSRSINADGDESVKLVLYGKGKYVNLFIPKGHNKYENALSELDYGDFIVYSADKNNNLLDYDKDFDCSNGDILHSSGGDNDGLSYYYGILDDADETAFSIDLIDSSTATKSKMCVVVREDGGITSLANVDRGVISGLSYSQLANYKQQGYEVLVRTYCAEPFQIVVYKR